MARLLTRLVIALVVLAGLVMGLQQIAAESGEVVVLTTMDEAGQPQQTRLWIVDRDGQQFLRVGVATSAWYARLRANDTIELERAGVTHTYTAIPEPDLRVEINDMMRQKYGWADQFISMLFSHEGSVPIRLLPQS